MVRIREMIESIQALSESGDMLKLALDYRDAYFSQRDMTDLKEAEIQRLKLEYARWGRDVVENFLIALERPEVDLRDALAQAVADMSDEVARLEEHYSPA